VLAVVVDDENQRVIQCRSGPRFGLETLQAIGVGSHPCGQPLQCDLPIERLVMREVNLTHASRADLPNNAVMANEPTDERVWTARRRATIHPGSSSYGWV
jgi:hypothetical protein